MGRRSDIKPLPSLHDPVTGDLRWKSIPANFRRAKIGDLVGTVNSRGYRVVGIDRTYYYVHRIIWMVMTGTDPVDQIDHEDTIRINNKWSNLREADNGKNRWNTRLAKNNRSGVKGVCWDARRNVWNATINRIRIGRFKMKQEAIAARLKVAEELHGPFMRVA